MEERPLPLCMKITHSLNTKPPIYCGGNERPVQLNIDAKYLVNMLSIFGNEKWEMKLAISRNQNYLNSL